METQPDAFVTRIKSSQSRIIGLKTVKSLLNNHFDANFFENEDEAVTAVLESIGPGTKVAFGGSQTSRQLDLQAKIQACGAVILDHNAEGLSQEKKIEIMRQQQVCDVFICSSNAISMKGELYNVDGNGNRVSAMLFGPGKVFILAGVNKICADETAAWERIKNIAAPMNMLRLERANPCCQNGTCMDCNLSSRGCNAYLVLRKKPTLTDISVFIINKDLGF